MNHDQYKTMSKGIAIWQAFTSVLTSFIRIQSKTNLERDLHLTQI